MRTHAAVGVTDGTKIAWVREVGKVGQEDLAKEAKGVGHRDAKTVLPSDSLTPGIVRPLDSKRERERRRDRDIYVYVYHLNG